MRTTVEREYWDQNALDPDVDIKYISDVSVKLCRKDLGKLNGEVLEIGCGVGRLLKSGWWGIDISQNMLDIANKRKPECGYKHTDGRSIPFEDEKFDVVFCYLVFQHLPKDAVEIYINEAYRVLKPGGKFIFQCILGTEDEPFSKHLDPEWLDYKLGEYSSYSLKDSVAHHQWAIYEAIK